MNKNTIAGEVKETGGKLRSKVDHALGDKKGEALGKKDEALGRMQKNFGQLEDGVKN